MRIMYEKIRSIQPCANCKCNTNTEELYLFRSYYYCWLCYKIVKENTMYLKKEVSDKVVQEIEILQRKAEREVMSNRREIKNLVKEQAILKRTFKKYTELVWIMKNK